MPLDPASCTLAAHASPVEMAFAANLLLVAWATVRDRFDDRHQSLIAEADALADNPYLQEELSIRRLRGTLRTWGIAGRVAWWVGLLSGLTSATALYVLMWHFPNLMVCSPSWRWCVLMVAVYLSPLAMATMFVLEKEGHRRATGQKAELDEAAERKRNQAKDGGDRVRRQLIETLARIRSDSSQGPGSST